MQCSVRKTAISSPSKTPSAQNMKASQLSLTVLVAALLGLSVTVPQTSAEEGQVPARRPRHRHPGQNPRPAGHLGEPLPDLTREQLNAFTEGLGEFEAVEVPEGGLGPIFNNTSCAICHSVPAIGGSSATLVTRFGRLEGGHFDPLTQLGGSLLQSQAIDPGALEKIPDDAAIVVHRQSTPLFGAGLVEAIPDGAILELARRRKADGVLGRAAMVEDVATGRTRVGRFGWKAQQATLLSFAGDAYLNEMGITSRLFPTENAPNGDQEKLAQFDHYADPEDVVDPVTGKGDIDFVADFMRFLAPPPVPRVTGAVQTGFNSFVRLGCAECHVPTLFTAPNRIRALDRKPVTLFSDLLLHDMGALNDGIAQADAYGNEMKTAPLWGLKYSAPYLHDGRAPTITDAIQGHDGEALPARDRFNKLTANQQNQLLEFLNAL
jgi:CxxC motif-containing protein (DUF1111 family)